MKLTFLSKTLGTIGLMAALTATVGTAMQKTVQAQTSPSVISEINDEACIASGFNSFYLLQGIDFSPAQLEEIYRISSESSDAYDRLMESYPKVEDLNSGPQFDIRPGSGMTSEMYDVMYARLTEISAITDSVTEQIDLLNEQFSQYGEFGLGTTLTLTSAQKAEIKETAEAFEAQSIAVMTPEQQQQYQENLETRSRINEVCGITKEPTVIDTIGFGFDSPNF